MLRPLVMRLPGFGEIVHVGRHSGRAYRTPVLAFHRGNSVVVALTYGPQSEWVQNVVRSGGCVFETRSRRLVLTAPRVRRDPQRRLVPRPIRLALMVLRAPDFLQLSIAAVDRIRRETETQRPEPSPRRR